MPIREIVKPRHGSLNYDTNAASDESGLKCEDPSLTVQSQRDDADINVIMKRFGITGMVPAVALPPEFGDFSMDLDYRQIMDLQVAAERSFMSLHADVRSRFGNDPVKFVEFALDKENLPELRRLGLAPDAVVPEKDIATRIVEGLAPLVSPKTA